MKHRDWRNAINSEPLDVATRLAYADWLHDGGMYALERAQRFLAERRKCVGPPCVLEAGKHEVTWFVEEVANSPWAFPSFVDCYRGVTGLVSADWCLPGKVFDYLLDYIGGGWPKRRDGGHHNRWAKSYHSARKAEAALGDALRRMVAGA